MHSHSRAISGTVPPIDRITSGHHGWKGYSMFKMCSRGFILVSCVMLIQSNAAAQFNLAPPRSSGRGNFGAAPNLSNNSNLGSPSGNQVSGGQIAGAIVGGLLNAAAQQAQQSQRPRPGWSGGNSNSGYYNGPGYYNGQRYYSNSNPGYSYPQYSQSPRTFYNSVPAAPIDSSGGSTYYRPSVTAVTPSRTASVGEPPRAAFNRKPIKVRVPRDESGICDYTLLSGSKSWNYSMEPGEAQTFKEDREWKIRYFSDGKVQEYELKGGQEYEFVREGNGWRLYKTS